MCERTLSVWFVCRLCRGSFGQVDAFIEHKKQKHFTQFQNTTSIVFEESEDGPLFPVVTSNEADHQIPDESNELRVKIEANEDEPINPFTCEIIEESNLDLVEVKSELITYESEINLDNENNFFGLKQPEQNPYVLLKRLTAEEIQRACHRYGQPRLLTLKQKNLANSSQPRTLFESDNITIDHKSTETQPTATGTIFTEHDLQFECKLCSKQLQSEAQLKIHVRNCALHHKDRNRFCVTCNRKFSTARILKCHSVRFHGTEEEKSSLFKFKCHLCQKPFQEAVRLRLHLETHKKRKQRKVETSKSKRLKCSQPNCAIEFPSNSKLQRHISNVHLGVKPFSCHFPNCSKTFSTRPNLKIHFLTHTGERPFKCTVDNCGKAFTSSQNRSIHYQSVHCNL